MKLLLRNKTVTYYLLLFSFFLFAVCLISDQYSYSQLSSNNNSDIFIDRLIEKADQLIYENKYEEAITYYDKVLEIDPKDIDALNNKGDALYDLDRYNEAIQYYDKVLEIDPKDIDALEMKNTVLDELD